MSVDATPIRVLLVDDDADFAAVAVEFLERGSDDVAVDTRHGAEAALEYLDDRDGFYVEDDGPGVPESERADVFEMGYTTSDDGTGFGLAIVERVADTHDWDVSLTEGEAGGARFEFVTE